MEQTNLFAQLLSPLKTLHFLRWSGTNYYVCVCVLCLGLIYYILHYDLNYEVAS